MDTENAALTPRGGPDAPKKKRKTWLWVLGWIFLFPVPVILLLKRSKMKTFPKVLLIILSWIGWMMLLGLISTSAGTQPPERPGDSGEKTAADAYVNADLLIRVFPALENIEDCEKTEAGDISPRNFVILRMDRYGEKLIAKNIDGDHSLTKRLTEGDAEKLDLIVVAASDSYVKQYAPYVDGERQDGIVTVRIGRAGLYYFDPATGKVFEEDSVRAANLGRREESLRKEYTLSNGQIIKAVDRRYHLDLGAAGRFGLWFTQDLGFLLFIGIAAAAGLVLLLRASWKSGRKKAGQAP